MKKEKLHIVFMVIFIGLTACTGNRSTEQQFEFRRYCLGYDLLTDSVIIESANQLAALKIENFPETGIHNIDVYSNESSLIGFFDVQQDMDYSKFMSNLKNHQWPQECNTLIEFLTGENAQLLERIFELDQEIVYQATEGQLKKSYKTDYKRYVSALELEEDSSLIEEYKRIHGIGMTWPEIGQNMKEIGIIDMEIYLMGTRAILLMDTKLEYHPQTDNDIWAKKPRELEWQTYVSRFQKTNPNSGTFEKWRAMKEMN